MDFNPYQPPQIVESLAGDRLTDEGLLIPSWGRVIANAALVSSLHGIISVAAFVLTNGILLLSLLILMPLSFSWHFCRTYRLPYRCVPKFGWLPWAFVFVSAMLTLILALGLRAAMGVTLEMYEFFRNESLPLATGGALLVGILCFAMDISLVQYVPRKTTPAKTLIIPVSIGFASMLFWLPVGYIWSNLFDDFLARLKAQQLLTGFMLGCSFAVAVFYSLIMAHPAVRERMLFAKTDPRQFTKREFRL